MHISAKQNNLDMCKRHINVVNVNETDEKMRAPLHVAMIFGSDAMCDLLLSYGADIYVKDSNRGDPIQLLFYYGCFKLREKNVKYFICWIYFIESQNINLFFKSYILSNAR